MVKPNNLAARSCIENTIQINLCQLNLIANFYSTILFNLLLCSISYQHLSSIKTNVQTLVASVTQMVRALNGALSEPRLLNQPPQNSAGFFWFFLQSEYFTNN